MHPSQLSTPPGSPSPFQRGCLLGKLQLLQPPQQSGPGMEQEQLGAGHRTPANGARRGMPAVPPPATIQPQGIAAGNKLPPPSPTPAGRHRAQPESMSTDHQYETWGSGGAPRPPPTGMMAGGLRPSSPGARQRVRRDPEGNEVLDSGRATVTFSKQPGSGPGADGRAEGRDRRGREFPKTADTASDSTVAGLPRPGTGSPSGGQRGEDRGKQSFGP